MEKIKLRGEIDNKYKWDLSKIYKNNSEVEEDIEKIKEKVEEFIKYEGKVMESSKTLLEVTKKEYEIIRILDKLTVYSNMLYHEDMDNNESKVLVGKISKLSDEVFEHIAFFTPELLESSYDDVLKYINEEKDLETYSFVFEDLFREKEHVLSLTEEQMLARLGEVFSASNDIYESLDDVDLKFGNIIDEDGNEVELNSSNFGRLLKSNDRNVRKNVFETFYKSYEEHKNTFAGTLKGSVSVDAFISKTRKYNNSLEMALYGDNIDPKLYERLISKINDNLDILHKYIDLKKQALNLDEIHLYDMYAPLVDNINKKYSYEEAKEMVLEALKPLGEEYINDLKNLFNSNCIDVYNNKNKRSGAYSWGCYDSLPYVLLNYEGTFNDVSTIAHELGHSMHSYYSKKNQEYHNSSYTIFLAEIASTVNEILLNKYAYEKASTKEEKLFILNSLLENFRTTLYRQTMFAEFEKIIHEDALNGETLTSDYLCETYYKLNKKYHGDNIVVDKKIENEWMRISHFYTSFYVYKYATGIAIASKIVNDILENKENAKENYLEFLKSGGKTYSLDILKNVGIDIVNDDTIDEAIKLFNNTLEEFKKQLNS